MATTSIKQTLNTANVTQELSRKGYNQYDVAVRYITGFKGIGIKVKSDLRDNDKNNSLSAIVGTTGNIIVSDFGHKVGLTIYEYVAQKYFGEGSRNYILGLNKIREDFQLSNLYLPSIATITETKSEITNSAPIKHNMDVKTTVPTLIEIRSQRVGQQIYWSSEDLYYWRQYGIDKQKLTEKNIIPLSAFWLTNYSKGGKRIKYDTSNLLAFAYPFQLNQFGQRMYKIYMPLGFQDDLDFKWVCNTNIDAIQNLFHIPKKGELLIVQSSYKDIMCMESMDEKIYSVAPPSESAWFSERAWNYFKTNWKHIVIFGNNDSHKQDNPGLKLARKHSIEHSLPFILPPDNTTSDISDYYSRFGEISARHLLKKLLYNVNNYLIAC